MGKFKDLTGMRFGRLVVLKRIENKGKSVQWLTKCDCGNEHKVISSQLLNHQCRSCGCLKKDNGLNKRLNLKGKKFNRLTIIDFAYSKNRKTFWRAVCDCGKEVIVQGNLVVANHTTSCGCRKKETEQENCFKKTHGMKGTRIYHTWRDMKNRCLNPNYPKFNNYGGRGIKICKDWENSFESFYKWAINNGYTDKLTIDKIDVNGDYYPENCRWADRVTQNYNKRNTIYITCNGQTHNVKEWSEITGIKESTIRGRRLRGLPPEEILKKLP